MVPLRNFKRLDCAVPDFFKLSLVEQQFAIHEARIGIEDGMFLLAFFLHRFGLPVQRFRRGGTADFMKGVSQGCPINHTLESIATAVGELDTRLGDLYSAVQCAGNQMKLAEIARARFELSESVWGIPFGFGVWLKMLAGDGGQYGWRNIFPKICASG